MNQAATRYDPNDETDPGSGGFLALAIIAAALGAGAAVLLAPQEGARTRRMVQEGLGNIGGQAAGTMAQVQRDLRRRRNQSRREKRFAGLAGLLLGAGLTALLTPASGSAARQELRSSLGRIKVGAVDRIERLRQHPAAESEPASPEGPVNPSAGRAR